ncbi:CHASE2 domain-containing protein, partial [Thermoleptolyngbya sp.]
MSAPPSFSITKLWNILRSNRLTGLKAATLTSLTVTGLVLGLRQVGGVEPLELRIYDRMVRLRAADASDPRLLVVEITEADIQALQRATPSDETLAQAIALLQQHQPRVIGLDLHRDVPQEPGHAQLQTQLQAPNLVAITKLGESAGDRIPPPPGLPAERIGFNDFVIDRDGVIRRSLLFAHTERETHTSLSLRLAIAYLKPDGIRPRPSAANPDDLQLGASVFLPLQASSGAYQRLDSSGYQTLLDYRARQHPARRVSLSQVLSQEFQPEWVRDKIVLIGTTAPSGKDLFYTPFSAGEAVSHQMPGVIVHAQMVSQFLDAATGARSPFWFWQEWQEWLWIFGWAMVGGAVAWGVRHPLMLGLSSVGLLGLIAGAGFGLFLQQGWVPMVAPAIASMMALGTVVAYRAQQSHRQQQMVMTLLGQNTSPEIADALWNARDRLLASGKLPGKRLVATMLFTDIKGFSTISEQMPPEVLLEWLNEYLEAMTHEIQQHHGIINKFTGDGLLAIFGVPMPRVEEREVDEDAYQAIACALAMGKRLEQLNQTWQQRGLPSIQMRVGIFTGPVVVGSLGGKERMEYGVIGDSVNTASRLESCLKDRQVDLCRVLIAEETLMHVKGKFQVESWGPLALSGKQQLVEV